MFYISIKLDKRKDQFHLWILIFSIAFIITAYDINLEKPWYGSTLCFWSGIIYFLYQDKFKDIFVLKHPVFKVVGCCFIMVLSIGLFFVLGGLMGLVISRNVAALSFVMVVIMLLHRFDLGNKESIWLGRYSYEIFLFHPLFINIFREKIENNIIYSCTVLGTTILASYIFKIGENGIKKIIRNV